MTFTGSKNLIILPTFNERDNIEKIIPEIWQVLPETHILVVDDNSPDGTGRLVDALSCSEPRLHILHRKTNRGLGPSYIDGFLWAIEKEYDTIFEMDADFSHQPKYLPTFLEKIQSYDIVLGCRYIEDGGVEGWATHRQWLSILGNQYAKGLLNMKLQDMTGGFKCFRRSALEKLPLHEIRSTGYIFQVEVTQLSHLMGLSIMEIPIVFLEREEGVSKMSWEICWEAMVGMWRLRNRSV